MDWLDWLLWGFDNATHTLSHTPVVDFSRRLRADPSGQAFFGIAGYTGISDKKRK